MIICIISFTCFCIITPNINIIFPYVLLALTQIFVLLIQQLLIMRKSLSLLSLMAINYQCLFITVIIIITLVRRNVMINIFSFYLISLMGECPSGAVTWIVGRPLSDPCEAVRYVYLESKYFYIIKKLLDTNGSLRH